MPDLKAPRALEFWLLTNASRATIDQLMAARRQKTSVSRFVARRRAEKKRGRRLRLPRDCQRGWCGYGSVTVVPSPLAEIENTPVDVSAVSAYADQPEGGVGTFAMNGPATWFWPFVT